MVSPWLMLEFGLLFDLTAVMRRLGGELYLTADGTIYIPFYDNNGNITRYLDSPGGALSETVIFYTAVVEIKRSLCRSQTSVMPLLESNDRVTMLAATTWSYNANETPRFNTRVKISDNMRLVLKRLINTRRWNNGWDSNAKVEVN